MVETTLKHGAESCWQIPQTFFKGRKIRYKSAFDVR